MFSFTTLAATFGLLSAAIAAPVDGDINYSSGLPKSYNWTVTNWSAGCARSGCYADFNVSGPLDNPRPSFLGYCSVSDSGYYQQCKLLESSQQASQQGPVNIPAPQVAAYLEPYNLTTANGVAALHVSFQFVNPES
jgi:hypothetical protein